MTDEQECRFEFLLDLPRDRAFSLFVDKLEAEYVAAIEALQNRRAFSMTNA